ncbi:Crp/Fnr family transcriptional regulator [Paenibacillus sp. WLX1005]|uniref:Crp/Fnr family transcriptional regulator n=1 Tax=Paenibacillus sp. WLX1005 TaxID=3243766 RepID=UPI003984555B
MYFSVADTSFFLNIVKPSNRQDIESKFVLKKYPRGQILYEYGDQGDTMYIVKSGSLKIYRTDDQYEIVLGHQFPGEAVGELELFHHNPMRTASVATLEPSELWMIRRSDMNILVTQYPELMRKVIYILSERLTQADRKIEYLAFLDARVRVANLLLDLCSNFGIQDDITWRINWKVTHQHFADMIGVTRETVTKVINQFQQDGWLYIEKRQFIITNLSMIQHMAGGNMTVHSERIWHSTHKYEL